MVNDGFIAAVNKDVIWKSAYLEVKKKISMNKWNRICDII